MEDFSAQTEMWRIGGGVSDRQEDYLSWEDV